LEKESIIKEYAMKISKLVLFLTFILSVLYADTKVISSPKEAEVTQPKQSKVPPAQMKPTGRKPNVVIILADDLGCGDMSLYNGWIDTPRIDKMAREGVRFTDFHSNSSVCSPTRIAFMTGRYQQRVGIVDVIVGTRDKKGLEPSEVTIAGLLKNAGYKTALFGKWHCGTDLRHNPTKHGFDEFVGFLTGAGDYHKHRNWYEGTQVKEQKGYSTHIITDLSVDFIRRNKDNPFFLYISHAAVHNPYQTPADTPENRPKVKQRGREYARPKYKVMLQELDKAVGKILDALKEHNLDKNTFVFFFSDNGSVNMGANERPYRGGKFSNYEGGHRVPAVARWPGRIKPDWTTDELTVAMDLLPTVMEIAGVGVPKHRKLDGISIKDHLFNQAPLPHRRIFFGYEPKLGTAMRDGHWKMQTKGDIVELYDLSNDIKETTNLVVQYPERTQQMKAAIEKWKLEVIPKTTSPR
jgi:arylsulfatase A